MFQSIPGQSEAKAGILQMVHHDRLPHAIMIAGGEGMGVLPMAFALAQFLLCEHRSSQDACGTCRNCMRVNKLEHPDLHVTYPVYKVKSTDPGLSKDFIEAFRKFFHDTPFGTAQDWILSIGEESKQGKISAAECQEIISQLSLKAYEGGYKIQIIWMPEFLEKEGNKLLKIIEEPPAQTVIVLATTNVQRVLPTIVSRVQTIRLTPVPMDQIVHALVSGHRAEESTALQVAAMANGSFGHALAMLEHTRDNLFPEFRGWFNALATNNVPDLIRFADEWAKQGRESVKGLLQYMLRILEETICYQFGGARQPALPTGEALFVQKLASRGLSFSTLQAMVMHVTDVMRYISQNAHGKTQLMALSIRFQYLFRQDFSLKVPH